MQIVTGDASLTVKNGSGSSAGTIGYTMQEVLQMTSLHFLINKITVLQGNGQLIEIETVMEQ